MPTSEGWQNFDRYSSFVRVLSYKAVPGKHPLSPHTFADVSQTRPRKIILPQLRRLVWDPPDVQDTIPRMRPAFAVLFLHSGVTSISMTFPDVPSIEPQGPTLLQVAACAPYLNDFTLNTKTHPVLIELCTLISNLPRLKVVTIPERFYTKRILNACSRLNVLHTINFGHRLRADFDISLAYQPIPPDVLSEPFQTLRTLRLNLNPIDITTAINSIPAPQRLTYMHIRLAHVEAENMARLIAFISRSSKALRGLDFTSGSSIQGRNDNIPTLSLSILRPLTLLPHLQSLSLLHLSPCALSLNDIDSLLSGLPTLVYLTLNNIPHYYEESPIGLDVLAIAGRRCRLLRTLGVLVDSTLPVTALPIKAGPQDPLLSNLEELSVGLSRITEDTTHSTAILLSNVLPITCDLEYGGSWSGGKSHQSSKYILDKLGTRITDDHYNRGDSCNVLENQFQTAVVGRSGWSADVTPRCSPCREKGIGCN